MAKAVPTDHLLLLLADEHLVLQARLQKSRSQEMLSLLNSCNSRRGRDSAIGLVVEKGLREALTEMVALLMLVGEVLVATVLQRVSLRSVFQACIRKQMTIPILRWATISKKRERKMRKIKNTVRP